MGEANRRGRAFVPVTAALVGALLAAAVAVRGIHGERPIAPADRPQQPDELREPMQFLGRGARMRVAELGPRISAENATIWKAAYRAPFDLDGCPRTAEWLVTPQGQRFERLLGDLRRGTREEAFAALVLVFELARRSEWKAGLLGRTGDAERLASFVQDWLRAWSERAMDDALLAEPAMAAALMYGRWMKLVARPRPIGEDEEAAQRALAFLGTLLIDDSGGSTKLARSLRARHPAAMSAFDDRRDVLEAFSGVAGQLCPDLTGECP